MLIAAPSERPLAAEKALGADLEFFDRFTGQLHHWAAYGVVLVIDAVDGDVDVTPALAVYRENRVTILGGIVGIGKLTPGAREARLATSRPIIGNSSTSVGVTFWLTSVLSTSTKGRSLVTSIISEALPTFSSALTVAVCPISSWVVWSRWQNLPWKS